MKNDYETGVLGGIATWAHLDKAEVFQGQSTGKLSITIQPTVKDAQMIKQKALEVWEAYKENDEKIANKKLKGEPNLGEKEDKEGNTVFKFVTNEKIHLKTGEVLKKNVPIFDGAGNEVTKKILKNGIGNGSEVVVSYQLFPYFNSTNVYGVSLRMQGIQILKYKQYKGGNDAESLGFGKVQGAFDASSLLEDDEEDAYDEIPFEDADF